MTRITIAALCSLLVSPAWGQSPNPCVSTLNFCGNSGPFTTCCVSFSHPSIIQIVPHNQDTLFMFEDGSPDRMTFYAHGKPIVLDFGKGAIDLGGVAPLDAVKALKNDLTMIVGLR